MKPERVHDRLHLVVVERAGVRVVLHDDAGVPRPPVSPEVERVVVGRIVGLGPAHEVDQGLRVAHVTLAPVGDRARGQRRHPRRDVEELRGLPVSMALVVSGPAVGQGHDLDVGAGPRHRELGLEVLGDEVLEVVVARHVDHHGPLRLRGCRPGAPGAHGDHPDQQEDRYDDADRPEHGPHPFLVDRAFPSLRGPARFADTVCRLWHRVDHPKGPYRDADVTAGHIDVLRRG